MMDHPNPLEIWRNKHPSRIRYREQVRKSTHTVADAALREDGFVRLVKWDGTRKYVPRETVKDIERLDCERLDDADKRLADPKEVIQDLPAATAEAISDE